MGKEHPRAPAPAEMSKKRKALEGGGEPQLPEEEPTAWFEGGREEQGRGRGGRHRKEPAGEVWALPPGSPDKEASLYPLLLPLVAWKSLPSNGASRGFWW